MNMINKEKRADCNFILTDLGRVDKEFHELLKSKDPFYKNSIYPILSYSSKDAYYKIKIVASDKNPNFDSRQYFMDNFESEKGLEKLAEFANKNNVGLITY